jgi:hypothetical protein
VGTWSERVEAAGATGAYYLDACGRLGRRDERAGGSAVYLSFARLGASRLPQSVPVETHLSQVGGASLSRSRGRANGTQNPGGCHPWREHEEGVKIIPAHNYVGVDMGKRSEDKGHL